MRGQGHAPLRNQAAPERGLACAVAGGGDFSLILTEENQVPRERVLRQDVLEGGIELRRSAGGGRWQKSRYTS